MLYEVKEMFGRVCTSFKKGQILYQALLTNFKEGGKVTLDFKGVEIVASPFFNAAIGQLYKDYSQEEIDKNLEIINLVETGLEIIERVRDNVFLQKDEKARKALDDVLTEELEYA